MQTARGGGAPAWRIWGLGEHGFGLMIAAARGARELDLSPLASDTSRLGRGHELELQRVRAPLLEHSSGAAEGVPGAPASSLPARSWRALALRFQGAPRGQSRSRSPAPGALTRAASPDRGGRLGAQFEAQGEVLPVT